MEIERKYHTEHQKWMEEIDDEMRKIQESMTEEEKLAEQKQSEQGFQRLLERFEEKQQKTRQVVDQRKKAYFEAIAQAGLALAEEIEADYKAESGETHGNICLMTSLVIFGVPDGRSGRDELMLLVRMADDIIITPNGDMIKWEFRFDFCDTFIG